MNENKFNGMNKIHNKEAERICKESLELESKKPLNYFEQKADQGKSDWTLMPFKALEPVLRVLEFGAKKYSRGGWKTVPDAKRRYQAALMRHVTAYLDGEFLDPETKLPHLAHAGCNVLFLLYLEVTK